MEQEFQAQQDEIKALIADQNRIREQELKDTEEKTRAKVRLTNATREKVKAINILIAEIHSSTQRIDTLLEVLRYLFVFLAKKDGNGNGNGEKKRLWEALNSLSGKKTVNSVNIEHVEEITGGSIAGRDVNETKD